MKKIIILFISLLVLACFFACGKSGIPNGEVETTKTAAPAFIYDDEMFSLYYIGVDNEYSPCLVFNVVNKTEQDIGFCFDAISVNGATEYPAFIVDVLAGTETEYFCDVSTTDGLESLTANICITDSEGFTIKECKINDVPLSE